MKNLLSLLLFVFLANNLLGQIIPNLENREFRGIWVATTKRIDYPKAYNLSANQLKDNYLELLQKYQENGYNAVVFQVRPAADAFFKSDYEPWSEWLTGKQGRDPGFDPLEFMVRETHKRNIEFHAWFNPYRAVATIQYADVCKNHITNTKPEWFFTYGQHKYFNPGIPEVRDYLVKIIVDVVKRYDIDGVHFDDYFYPYPERNDAKKIIDIPDQETFKKYANGFTNIADWRRDNINQFIKAVNQAIKAEKPWVRFGIAPYGVWRNKQEDPDGSNTKSLSGYDYLFADALEWLKKGYVDYIAPQCYWQINHKLNDFEQLVQWWNNHSYGKNVYIGLGAYNQESPKEGWMDKNEVANQINITRKFPNVKGVIVYRSSTVEKNPYQMNQTIKQNCFKENVLTPDMGLDAKIIAPELSLSQNKNRFLIEWQRNNGQKVSNAQEQKLYAVYRVKGNNVDFTPSKENFLKYQKTTDLELHRWKKPLFKKIYYTYKITAFNRYYDQSAASNPITIIYHKKDKVD